MFYGLEKEDIPAWYEIGSIENGKGFLVRVHRQAHHLLQTLKNSPIIRDLQDEKDLRLGLFIPPTEKSWGFGEVLTFDGDLSDHDWVTYRAEFPQKPTTHPGLYDFSATINVLFIALSMIEEPTTCEQKQLIEVGPLRTSVGIYGGGISATVSPQLCKWVNTRGGPNGCRLKTVENIMSNTNTILLPQTKEEREDFEEYLAYRIHVELRPPKWVNLTVPGDACGLDPDNYYNQSLDEGYKLSPHNTDSPIQQMVLFSGLCALHDQARRDGF